MKQQIQGTPTRPRLYVFKSNKHIYAQIIDDSNNKILTSSSTISKNIKNNISNFATCKTAKIIGYHIAQKLKQHGINQVVFDRGKKIYHGQIKALADATRKEGIIF